MCSFLIELATSSRYSVSLLDCYSNFLVTYSVALRTRIFKSCRYGFSIQHLLKQGLHYHVSCSHCFNTHDPLQNLTEKSLMMWGQMILGATESDPIDQFNYPEISSRNWRIFKDQWDGVPSCCNMTSGCISLSSVTGNSYTMFW